MTKTRPSALATELQEIGYLKSPRLVDAFNAIDRADFVSAKFRDRAYEEVPLPIGFGQTISQPLTVAFLLEALAPEAGERILDVGAGSGYQTALLAWSVGPKGLVIGVERISELADLARANLSHYPALKGRWEIVIADGSKGCLEKSPYDRIAAAASAAELPSSWIEQVKIGGRIVAPVGEAIVAVDKISETEFTKTTYPGFAFVPLIKDETPRTRD
ncbi:MAG: protein-L-isoaspartate O-methyltransferase [Patescibacteria group bacterium]